MGLSRRVCLGCAGLVAICALAAYLRTGAPSKTSTSGASHNPAAAAAVADYVELDPASAAVVAAAVDAVDAMGATFLRVCSLALFVWYAHM